MPFPLSFVYVNDDTTYLVCCVGYLKTFEDKEAEFSVLYTQTNSRSNYINKINDIITSGIRTIIKNIKNKHRK